MNTAAATRAILYPCHCSDFMCTYTILNVTAPTSTSGMPPANAVPTPRIGIVFLLCFIIALHFTRMVSRISPNKMSSFVVFVVLQ